MVVNILVHTMLFLANMSSRNNRLIVLGVECRVAGMLLGALAAWFNVFPSLVNVEEEN